MIKYKVLLALLCVLSFRAAASGDLFVQVDFDGTCSILRVTPEKQLSEWVSAADISEASGVAGSDCSDTGLVATADGFVYFSEDVSDNIFRVSPTGDVEVFVAPGAVSAVTGTPVDFDSGMVRGPDGHLYVGDEESDSIVKIRLPGGNDISVVVTESKIAEASGSTGADLEGGIAIDSSGNLFVADDGTDSIIKVLPAGPAIGGGAASIFASKTAISAATGNADVDLDVGQIWDGKLFIADDSSDAVLRISSIGNIAVLASTEDLLFAVPTNTSIDPEGGLAVDVAGRVYLGDDGQVGTIDLPNIIRINGVGETELFLSANEIQTFYQTLYPGATPRLRGSMAIQRDIFAPQATTVPTLPFFGLLALAGLLGLFGLRKLRK